MKYQPGERFGDWLVLGRSVKRQSNGKRNFRWCMCLGCNRPYRVRIGNLATGATSGCKSCKAIRLTPRELLNRRFQEGRKRISAGLVRSEMLRWNVPQRIIALNRRKVKRTLDPWMRKCNASASTKRYKPKGNQQAEKSYDNWQHAIPNALRRAAKRHRNRRKRLDRWLARCGSADTKCRQRQRESHS